MLNKVIVVCWLQPAATCCNLLQDRAFDALLEVLASVLPVDAVIVTDLRQLRRVLDVQRPSKFAHYACKSGMCFLHPLRPGTDPLGLEPCSCGHPWFEEVRSTNGRKSTQATGQVTALAGMPRT